MTQVVHEHTNSGNGMGIVMGVLLAVALLFLLFFLFGRGFLNGGTTTTPEVNIPDQVDVNVQQPQQ